MMKPNWMVAAALGCAAFVTMSVGVAGQPGKPAANTGGDKAADKLADAPSVPSVSAAFRAYRCLDEKEKCPLVSGGAMLLEGFKWGMNHADITKLYNQNGGLFDRDYDPILAKTQPGVTMQAIEAERENKKLSVQNSFIEFKDTPTGFDATPLKLEYTYRNRESVLVVDGGIYRRYFFFMGTPPGERLWKIYEEVRLSDKGPLGATFQTAVGKVGETLGVAPRVRAADPSQGLSATTVDWQDNVHHFRMIDRTREKMVGIVIEERSTLNALPQLRSNKQDDPFALDPSIKAITSGGISDPNAVVAPAPSSSAKKKGGNPPKR